MQIFKFRIVLDSKDSVFRDIEIDSSSKFNELHDVILNAFDFSGTEMASFFMSNERWDRGEEIPLFDMSDGGSEQYAMNELSLEERLTKKGDKVLYVYDFLRLWIFYVELVDVYEANANLTYPNISMSVGDAPDENSKDLDFTMETELDEDAPEESGFDDPEDPGEDFDFEDYR